MDLRGPCGVSMVAGDVRASFGTDEWYLPASVFTSEVSITHVATARAVRITRPGAPLPHHRRQRTEAWKLAEPLAPVLGFS